MDHKRPRESCYEEIDAVVEARAVGVMETRDEAEGDRYDRSISSS